jgi:hypothetical protein
MGDLCILIGFSEYIPVAQPSGPQNSGAQAGQEGRRTMGLLGKVVAAKKVGERRDDKKDAKKEAEKKEEEKK